MKNIIAITGPSGIGKTTLGNLLIEKENFVTPIHSTTRNRRLDDIDGFYRYLTFDEFKMYAEINEFLFWSGDSHIIDQKYGNFYGILKKDFYDVSHSDRIIIYISYKDIEEIIKLKNNGMNIEIVNLIYNDLERNLPKRISSSKRGCTDDEIEKRLKNALDYEIRFREMIDSHDEIIKIPNDILTPEETCEEVVKRLVKRR